MRNRVLGCVALSLLPATNAFAQTARVGGRITDPQGGALPGVTVTMTHEATGLGSETVTNAAGSYLFPSLDPGVYRLEAIMAGFAPWCVETSFSWWARGSPSMPLSSLRA